MFLTNNFTLPALTIAQLYKCRWQVELFFKWIKQHLRIKAFYRHQRQRGEDPSLDRHQRLRAGRHREKGTCIQRSLYELLQILSLTVFEGVPLIQLLTRCDPANDLINPQNQLNLFN